MMLSMEINKYRWYITHFNNQLNGALVRFLTPANMVFVRAQHAAVYMALILLLFGYINTVFMKQQFGDSASAEAVSSL